MSLMDTLFYAFSHVYHEDRSNAAMHCAAVRFSPITFRLAEAIFEVDPDHGWYEVNVVLDHKGKYEEDSGR